MATVGRPYKYDPAFCDEAVEFLADGYSVAALAGHLGFTKQTIYNWMDENEAFFDAVKRGQAKAVLFWEKANIDSATKGEGNATSIIFGLKNRAPEEWRDKHEVDNTSSDGSMRPVVIEVVGKPVPANEGED